MKKLPLTHFLPISYSSSADRSIALRKTVISALTSLRPLGGFVASISLGALTQLPLWKRGASKYPPPLGGDYFPKMDYIVGKASFAIA